jgi:hypothetical protein
VDRVGATEAAVENCRTGGESAELQYVHCFVLVVCQFLAVLRFGYYEGESWGVKGPAVVWWALTSCPDA